MVNLAVFSMTSSRTSFQNMPSSAIHPWRLPGVCPQTKSPGRSRFSLNQDAQQGCESVKSQDNTRTLRHYLSIRLSLKKVNRGHVVEPVVLHPVETPLHLHASEMSSFQIIVQKKADTAISPISIPSSPLPRPNLLSGDLYKTTLTDLNRHFRGVCNPSKGIVTVAPLAMFTAS